MFLSVFGAVAPAAALGKGALQRRVNRTAYLSQDLDVQVPGSAELNLTLGGGRSAPSTVWTIADLELDIGLARSHEIGVDLQYGRVSPDGAFSFLDHAWLSFKHLAFAAHGRRFAFAAGAQHGPRIAAVPGAEGVGYQALGVISATTERWQLLATAGAAIEPRELDTGRRPLMGIAGAELSLACNPDWALVQGWVMAVSGDGMQWSATTDLEASLSPMWTLRAGAIVGRSATAWTWGGHIGAALFVSVDGHRF